MADIDSVWLGFSSKPERFTNCILLPGDVKFPDFKGRDTEFPGISQE